MKKPPVISMTEWQAAISEVRAGLLDVVPAGWLTVRELGEQLGKSERAVFEWVAALVRAKRAEKKTFKILRDDKPRWINHYRLK